MCFWNFYIIFEFSESNAKFGNWNESPSWSVAVALFVSAVIASIGPVTVYYVTSHSR